MTRVRARLRLRPRLRVRDLSYEPATLTLRGYPWSTHGLV